MRRLRQIAAALTAAAALLLLQAQAASAERPALRISWSPWCLPSVQLVNDWNADAAFRQWASARFDVRFVTSSTYPLPRFESAGRSATGYAGLGRLKAELAAWHQADKPAVEHRTDCQWKRQITTQIAMQAEARQRTDGRLQQIDQSLALHSDRLNELVRRSNSSAEYSAEWQQRFDEWSGERQQLSAQLERLQQCCEHAHANERITSDRLRQLDERLTALASAIETADSPQRSPSAPPPDADSADRRDEPGGAGGPLAPPADRPAFSQQQLQAISVRLDAIETTLAQPLEVELFDEAEPVERRFINVHGGYLPIDVFGRTKTITNATPNTETK